MIQNYPASELPLPQASYSAKPVTNTVTTTFASGRPRRRRMGHGKYYAAKLSWSLSPEEYDFFMGWWEHKLSLGVLPFQVEMATGALLGPHVVQLVDDPDTSLQGYFWTVTCNAVVLSKPELSEQDVALRSEGLGDGTFQPVEEELNTIVNVDLPNIMEA